MQRDDSGHPHTASLLFQSVAGAGLLTGWMACVWGAARGWPMLGPAVVAGLLLLASFRLPDPLRNLGLVAMAGVLGTGLESLLLSAGVYALDRPTATWICPLWITCQWVNVGLALIAFSSTLAGRLHWACLLGLLGGGSSALLAERLGAVHLARPVWGSAALMAAEWSLALPALLWLATRSPYRSAT